MAFRRALGAAGAGCSPPAQSDHAATVEPAAARAPDPELRDPLDPRNRRKHICGRRINPGWAGLRPHGAAWLPAAAALVLQPESRRTARRATRRGPGVPRDRELLPL